MGPVTAKGGNVCKSDGHPYAFFVATSLHFSMAVNMAHSPPALLAGKEIPEWVEKNYWNGWKRISGMGGNEILEYSTRAERKTPSSR